MSIQSEIDRIEQNIANTYTALSGLGADMPTPQNSDNLAQTVGDVKAVLYIEQTLTEEQQTQARRNIGAPSAGSVPDVPSWALEPQKPSYTKSEVGLGNVDNVKQYSASNPPPYPVTNVNGKTGAVSLSAADVGAVPDASIVQGTGNSTTKVMSQAAVTNALNALTNEKVDVNAQTLTEKQKAQVRKNIGADTVLRLSKGDLEDMADADLESKYQEGVRLLAVDDGYTNLVPLSTNLHGAVYCGCGYITGYRMSSNGKLTEHQWACVSGFIPFEYGKTIRIVGATGPATNSSMYIALYDETYTFITVLYLDSVTAGNLGSYTARKDGFYEATFNTSALTSGTMYNNMVASSYIRVSLNPCEGGNMIVTMDEEIPEV